MHKILLKKGFMYCVIILLIGSSTLPSIHGNNSEIKETSGYNINQLGVLPIDEGILDGYYIYNITAALSNIIFTEYNESTGEIAKGRAFGTKGEWAAAKILYDNMSILGLNPVMDKIENIENVFSWSNLRGLTHKIEVLAYELKIDGIKVECAAGITPYGPDRSKPSMIDHNFSYNGLKVKLDHPKLLEKKEDYVLIRGTKYPENLNGTDDITAKGLKFYLKLLRHKIENLSAYYLHPHCKGIITYDYNNDSHNQVSNGVAGNYVPYFWINGSLGREIVERVKNNEDVTVDFYLDQRLNISVISYNVIGTLEGNDPSKTVVIGCLYDGWWNQATADSAMGMAIVMGIAKYFVDNDIYPKYNIKFIGYAGEEYGMRGSLYYEAKNRKENIVYVIDLNQLGFTQESPRLKLEVVANTKRFKEEVWDVVKRTDYVSRVNNVADIMCFNHWMGHISDDRPFAINRIFRCKTVCFLKGGPWLLHHRDGMGHTEGDVLKYFNWTDINVTGEIIWNVTEHLTVDKSQNPIFYNLVGLNVDDNLLSDIKR